MNATVHSTTDIRNAIDSHFGPFVLILDEIHYLNKRLQSIFIILYGGRKSNLYRYNNGKSL